MTSLHLANHIMFCQTFKGQCSFFNISIVLPQVLVQTPPIFPTTPPDQVCLKSPGPKSSCVTGDVIHISIAMSSTLIFYCGSMSRSPCFTREERNLWACFKNIHHVSLEQLFFIKKNHPRSRPVVNCNSLSQKKSLLFFIWIYQRSWDFFCSLLSVVFLFSARRVGWFSRFWLWTLGCRNAEEQQTSL